MTKAKRKPRERVEMAGLKYTSAHGCLAGLESVDLGGGLDWQDANRPPEHLKEAFKLSRGWHQNSLFVQTGLGLKIGFANYEFKVAPVEKGVEAADRQRFREWWRTNERAITRFVREVWEDYFMMDNAVAFWRTGPQASTRKAPPQILMLKAEDCDYSDAFGLEKLKVQLRVKQKDLEGFTGRGVSQAFIKRWTQKTVELKASEGEHFRVLKRARIGDGFAWPRIVALFRALNTQESMEVSDNLWSFMSRVAVRQFKMGHEIKQGPHAGKPLHFWNKKRSEAIKKLFQGKLGWMDFDSNFDVDIEFPFPSLERFDKKKYEGVFQRIALWLGPVGLFMFSQAFPKGLEDVLMRMLRAQMLEERREVGLFCAEVIQEVFRPPVPVKVRWGEKIFVDSRQAMEFAKYLLQQGALSQRTGLEEIGEDQEEQWENKDREGELANSESTKHRVMPVFDPAHGKRPSEPGGRPSGQKS